MKPKHRKILSELAHICNQLGVGLDYTATHESKIKDRQQALMKVGHVLYGVLVDMPENDYKENDWQEAEKCLEELRQLQNKVYPDRNGHLNFNRPELG